jgi:hypothetical protein
LLHHGRLRQRVVGALALCLATSKLRGRRLLHRWLRLCICFDFFWLFFDYRFWRL